MEIEIRDKKRYSHFVATEDGKEVGEAAYHTDQDGCITITHMEIKHRYRGTGMGERLMRMVVEHARENNLKIVPVCSFARTMFKRYPEIRDVLEPAQLCLYDSPEL